MKFFKWIAEELIARSLRTPYFHIYGKDGSLYMARYWLVKPSWWTLGCGARIHAIARPDRERHLHDHPWPFVTVILRGGYIEHRPLFRRFPESYQAEPTIAHWRCPGAVLFRRARSRHRIDLPLAWQERVDGPRRFYRTAWTLFIFGPRAQTWGFYTAEGKVPWRRYLPHEEAAYQESEHLRHGVPE